MAFRSSLLPDHILINYNILAYNFSSTNMSSTGIVINSRTSGTYAVCTRASTILFLVIEVNLRHKTKGLIVENAIIYYY